MRVEGKIKINQIGTRHGEKLYESLLGSEEGTRAIDRGGYFQVPLDARSLDYQIYFDKGQSDVSEEAAYTSHNTSQLNIDQVVELISLLPEFIEYKATYL
jgi:UDP-glucose 4-epimerase